MKKPLIYAGVTVGALAVGLSGFWFWGAGRVEAAVDAQAQALEAQGLSLRWAERSISGFPFRYVARLEQVTLADMGGDWSMTLPWTETAAPLFGGQVLRTTTAETGALTAATPDPALGPDPLVFALTLEGLTLDTPLVGAAGARVSASALAFSAEPSPLLREARVRLSDVAATLETFVAGGGKVDLRAAELTSALDVADGEGRSTFVASDVALSVTTEGGARIDIDSLAAGEGSASIDLRVGASRSEAPAGVASTGLATGRLAILDGRLTYFADGQDVRMGVALGPDLRGAARMARATAGLDVPVRPTPTPQAYTLRVGLDSLELEDTLWAALDPQGRLPHDPVGLNVEIGGQARVTDAVSAAALSSAPVRVETVEITRATLNGLGARVAADGMLTIIPGQPTPEGRLNVRAEGWAPVLQAVVELGFLGLSDASAIVAMSERLGRTDADEGVFESQIELREGQIWANGERVQ